MKRKNLFLMLILAICMLSQTMVFADWEPYYEEIQNTSYATRVQKSWNDAGQTVYTAYNSYGNVILDIRARGGNIWNETTKVLCTSTNKGPDFVGIAAELDVYGVNLETNPMKYRKGFQNGEVPYRLRDVYATSIQTNSNGVTVGFNTNSGVYNIDSSYNNSNSNVNYDYDSYPRVTQNGNKHYYYYRSNSYFTYNYNPNTEKLESVDLGKTISSISEIKFTPGYLIAVTNANKVKQIRIGTLETVQTYTDKFYDWRYYTDSNGNSWVRGYVDVDGDVHYFDTDYDYWYDDIYDDDDYWNNDDDDRDYPNFYQSGTNSYIYCKNSSTDYKYTLSSAEKLSYNGTILASNVIQVWFARGYIVFVVYDEDEEESILYKSKIGSTTKTVVCSNFEEFKYDNDGFAIEAVTESGRSYDL